MAKKDIEPQEEKDRSGEEEKKQKDMEKESIADQNITGETEVKNAHATGLGSIGRSEEKQTGDTQGISVDY